MPRAPHVLLSSSQGPGAMQRLPAGPRPTGSPDTASACSCTALCHPVLAYFPAGIHQAKVRANDQLLIRRREPPRGEGSYQRAAVCCGSLVYPGPTLQRAGESLQHHVKGAGGNPASQGTQSIPSLQSHHIYFPPIKLPTAAFPSVAPQDVRREELLGDPRAVLSAGSVLLGTQGC